MTASFVNAWSPSNTPISVAPSTIGNAMIAGWRTHAANVDPVPSGGGVTTWIKLQNYQSADPCASLWWGVITATGAQTISVSIGVGDMVAAEFAGSGPSPPWTVVGSGQRTDATVAEGLFPPVTSVAPVGESFYFGYSYLGGTFTGGPGPSALGDLATYGTSFNGNGWCYIAPCLTQTVESPSCTQSGIFGSVAVGAIVTDQPLVPSSSDNYPRPIMGRGATW